MLVRMRETEIQRAIIDNLRWRGILAFRCQPAPVPIRNGRNIVGFRKADPFNVGIPDIICVIRGRFVGIEVKSAIGRESPEQRDWQGRIERAGGVYVLARSWEDVEKAMASCMETLQLDVWKPSN
jgi:hypothetical protein